MDRYNVYIGTNDINTSNALSFISDVNTGASRVGDRYERTR